MRGLIFWQDIFLSLVAQKKQALFGCIFLIFGIVSCATSLHIRTMIAEASQAYWEKHKLIGISLYQTQGVVQDASFALPRWHQLQQDLEFQKISVIAYQPMGALVTSNGKIVAAQVVGIEPALFEWLGLKLKSGRFLSTIDEGQKIAVVGHAVVSDLFILNQKEVLSTVGVLEPMEVSPWFDFDINQCIFVPLTTLSRLGTPLDPTSLLLKYQDQNSEDVQKTFQTVFQGYSKSSLFFQNPQNWGFLKVQFKFFQETIWFFSFFMLSLGLVFIVQMMNNLLIQRRYELGVRMALGASAEDCVWTIGAQVFILTAGSSGVGLVLSLIITSIFAYMFSWPWVLSTLGLMMHFILIIIALGIVRIQLRKIYTSTPCDFLV